MGNTIRDLWNRECCKLLGIRLRLLTFPQLSQLDTGGFFGCYDPATCYGGSKVKFCVMPHASSKKSLLLSSFGLPAVFIKGS